MGDRVQRTASFIDGDNNAMIVICSLAVDAGNNHTPVWPLNIMLGDMSFRFLKDGISKRPIYKSDSVFPYNQPLADLIINLREAVSRQNDTIIKLSKELEKYKKINDLEHE